MQNIHHNTYGPFTQGDGAQLLSMGSRSHHPWREICIAVQDAAENTIAPATDTLTGEAMKIGSDRFDTFEEQLDLAGGDRSWKPFFSAISHIRITPVTLPANAVYFITINTYEL